MFARLTSVFMVLVVVTSITAASSSADTVSCIPGSTAYCCSDSPSGDGMKSGCVNYDLDGCTPGREPFCCEHEDTSGNAFGCSSPQSQAA